MNRVILAKLLEVCKYKLHQFISLSSTYKIQKLSEPEYFIKFGMLLLMFQEMILGLHLLLTESCIKAYPGQDFLTS